MSDRAAAATKKTTDLITDVFLYSFPRTTVMAVLVTPILFFKARQLRVAEPSTFVARGVFSAWTGTLAACIAEITVPRFTGKYPEKLDLTPLGVGFFGAAVALRTWFATAGAAVKPLHLFRPCLFVGLAYFAYYWIDDILYARHLLKTLESAAAADVPPERVRPYLRRRYLELRSARKHGQSVSTLEMWKHPDSTNDLAHRPDAFYPTPRMFFSEASVLRTQRAS